MSNTAAATGSLSAQKQGKTPDDESRRLLPFTVLSGFLGAGKTTLLKKILREPTSIRDPITGETRPRKIAVIVNDMGAINLDADEIKRHNVLQEEAEMVELHNGCVCCTLRGDLLKNVKKLAEENTYDYAVIETTGISEPLPIAQTFTMSEEELEGHDHDEVDASVDEPGSESDDDTQFTMDTDNVIKANEDKFDALSNYARLDTMVTVVDAVNIFDVLHSIETLADKNNATRMTGNQKETEDAPEDDRSIVQLFLDQVEFASVILVSKIAVMKRREGDTEGERRSRVIAKLLKKLNPKARVVMPEEDHYADLDIEAHIMNTNLFKMEEEQTTDAWIKELNTKHTPETEEYGISSMVFESNEFPFHPERLDEVVKGFGHYVPDDSNEKRAKEDTEPFRGVFRSKGQVWLANANAYPLDLHTAGRILELEPQGMPFLHAIPKEDWEPDCYEIKRKLEDAGRWSDTHGDRFSRLVLIGVNMNKGLIEERLRAALVTEKETAELGGEEGWKTLTDPFFDGQCADEFFEPHVNEMDDEDLECNEGACTLDKKGEDCENCPHDVDAGAPCPAMATRAKTTSDAKGDVSMVLRAKYI